MLLENFLDPGTVLIGAADGRIVTRADIKHRCDELLEMQSGNAGCGLAFLIADLSMESALDFHACLEAEIPVALLDAASDPSVLSTLTRTYSPDLVLMPGNLSGTVEFLEAELGEHSAIARQWVPDEYTQTAPRLWLAPSRGPELHADLAVLLTTSGSTGSPKFVRLSRRNVKSNAAAIAKSLSLTPMDRGVTSLPPFYSFGMSILTSHAAAGSPVVITTSSVIEPGFWSAMADYHVTLLPGVPQTYQMLRRLHFSQRQLPNLPSLRGLMQAGGRLDTAIVNEFADSMAAHGGEFFVMYGQTEAAPRIACLPPRDLAAKLGSAGIALEGGRIEIRDPEHPDAGPIDTLQTGEVFYIGPNVMMGYAESRADLMHGDIVGGVLATGDIGYLDNDGFLFLTGRSKRIAKIAGLRISLDEVEGWVAHLAPVAAVEGTEGTLVVYTAHRDIDLKAASRDLARRLRVPPRNVRVQPIAALPLLASGKVDFRGLTDRAKEL